VSPAVVQMFLLFSPARAMASLMSPLMVAVSEMVYQERVGNKKP